MRVPFEWLREFVPVNASAEEVAGRLTMLGLEVEGAEQVDGDTVFEINVTPNRPDCLSIIGIARELSAAYGAALKIPEHDVAAEQGALDFNVDILDTALCRRYAGRIIKNLRIGPSPDWMKQRLEKCGIRSINNVVDVTNYVLLELGHPLHAFDLKTVKGQRIRIGTPKSIRGKDAEAELKTLDGIEHNIPKDALLIWDMKRPIAIAGIMGGLDTEVTDTTKDVFIESAYFNPVSVRVTSKVLGIKTESSYRFERGADIKMLKKALDRAAYLMKKIAGGVIFGKIDIYPKRFTPPDIAVRYDKVNRILGLKLTRKDMLGHLGALGFKIEESGEYFKVKPPTFRVDIERDADIIEEIARTYGYDRIPATLPRAAIGTGGQGDAARLSRGNFFGAVRDSFLKSGYTEVINYSFMGVEDLDLLGIAPDDERRNLVRIRNPLRTEDSFMRTTLVPSLIRNVLYNIAYGNKDLKLFEIAKVFISRDPGADETSPKAPDSQLPVEKSHLAAVYYKEKGKSLYKDDAPDFSLFKGVIEAILADRKISGCSFARSSEHFLHPGQSADIIVGGVKAGYLGALSPELVGSLDIKAQKVPFLVMELDIDALAPHAMQLIRHRPLPRFPFIERDTAIIVDASLEASAIIGWIGSYPSELIEEVSVFDVYQGKNIPEGKKSVAFNVRYRASERTLRDEEVDLLHHALVEYILDKTKGQLRQ